MQRVPSMNRDEAVRCSQIAQEHFRSGNYESAMKFFLKSYKLEQNDDVLNLIKRCEELIKKGEGSSSSQSNNTHNANNQQHQNNHGRSKSEHGTSSTKSAAGTNAAITMDNVMNKNEDIKKVLATKDFYDILGVTKTATDEEIKKSYRKLALKFHPDKNKEVGADEAFKKLAQAYDCLINPEKRQKYDEFGNEEPEQHYRHYRQYYDDDISAEDIFGMFFGNAFFQEGPTRRRFVNRQHRQQHHHHQGEQQGNGQARNQNKLLPLLQFLPLLIIIISSFALNFSQEEALYSNIQTQKYNIMRHTQHIQVPYFVERDFESKIVQRDRRKFTAVEESIEVEYVGKLRNKCATIQQKIRSLQNQASRAYYESDKQRYLDAANAVDYSSCEKFTEIQRKYPQLARSYYYY